MKENKYMFESEFTESNGCILRVNCESKYGMGYEILVDFSGDGDPYPVYYYEGKIPDDNDIFRKELFSYLRINYPECF